MPDQIASISRDRELAVQDAKKYTQQIEQAKSQAELAKQEMLAQQNKEKVEADTSRIRAVINAKQGQAVQVVSATKDLEVAKVRNEASLFQAEAVTLKAQGEQMAIRANNEAQAAVLTSQAQALDGGMNLARYVFYQRLGPRIQSILSSDDKQGLGAIFGSYLPAGKEVPR